MLKTSLTDTEYAALPEALKGEYKLNGEGKYVVQLDGGFVPKAELNAMRDRNLAVIAERDQAQNRLREYEGIGDLEVVKGLKDREQEINDSKLIRSNKLDELVEQRTEKMRKDHETALQAEKNANSALTKQLSDVLIDQEVTANCAKLKVRSAAIPMIVQMVKSRTKMENGKAVVYKQDGSGKAYDGNSNEMTIGGLTQELVEANSYLQESNSGGGTPPGGGGDGGGGGGGGEFSYPNPFLSGKDHNLSRQMEVARKNPKLANKWRAEANLPALELPEKK